MKSIIIKIECAQQKSMDQIDTHTHTNSCETHNVSINNFQKGVYVHSQCIFISSLTLSPWSMCEKFMSCEGSRLSSISTLLWKHFKIASSANDSLKHAIFHWNWNHFRLTLVALLQELMEWVNCGKIEMDHWSWREKLFCYANGKFRFNVNFYRSQPTNDDDSYSIQNLVCMMFEMNI